MIPYDDGNVGGNKKRPDGRGTGLHCQFGSSTKIEHSLFFEAWGISCLDEGPTPIKNHMSQIFGNIDGTEIGGTKSRHKQDELQIGHARVVNI